MRIPLALTYILYIYLDPLSLKLQPQQALMALYGSNLMCPIRAIIVHADPDNHCPSDFFVFGWAGVRWGRVRRSYSQIVSTKL